MGNLLLFFFFQANPDGDKPGHTPLDELFLQFAAFFPKMVGALVILLIGWLVAKLVKKLLTKLLEKIGIDRFAEMLNEIDLVRNSGMEVKLSTVLGQVVYYVMMLIFVITATEALGVQAVTKLVTDALNYLPYIFSASVVFLLGLFLADMVKGLVKTVCLSLGLPSAGMIANGVFYFLLITVGISALAQAQINTNFISANITVIIGAVALAFSLGYGFASRDLMANYLAGYYNKNKIRVGDEVRISGERGKVVMIDASSVFLQTADRAVIIPLSKLVNETIEVFYPEAQTDALLESGSEPENSNPIT
ncbi:MAG: mechanosensitive ion channel [Bacteroidetes bacterium]|nr:mechanosensitive ion channel [Bacteroidota bacterium]